MFDPVHNGHINLATQVISKSHLDGAMLVPSYRHPFKDACRADYDHRLAMLKLALADAPALQPCDIEREKKLSGYTIDTVKALRERYPRADLSFVIGEDNLEELDRWRRPDEIFAEVRVLVGQRPPHRSAERIKRFPADRIEMVAIEMIDVSSTAIRELFGRRADKAEFSGLLPDAVIAYIDQQGLYR